MGSPQRPQAIFTSAVLYVADVERSLCFYERAFGLTRRFVDDRLVYAELETGTTTLALTQRAFAEGNACRTLSIDSDPPPTEIAFTVEDVGDGVESAIAAGGALVRSPALRYWGQTVAYVRDPDGYLLQLSSPLVNG